MSRQSRNLLRTALAACTMVLVPLVWDAPGAARAEGWEQIMARRPDLFDPATGYRIDRQRAPTPDDIPPPARLVEAGEVERLAERGALLLDVYGARQSRYDELDGTWLTDGSHRSLPGAVWLPETGRGALTPELEAYLGDNLERMTGGDKSRAIVVFCVADCWMSWNAARRIAALGHGDVNWFRLGTDGWEESGRPLVPVTPVPVNVD